MHQEKPSPSVVVGIDGSKAAVSAALWAIEEATSRDLPIRLLYAIDPETSPENQPHHLASAEIAVRYAYTAVEATEQPVKLEIEIVQDSPTTALIRASASAEIICIGAVGSRHFSDERTGSTAETLAVRAHCPVAIIRDGWHQPVTEHSWVVALVDATVRCHAVIEAAVKEARLRGAQLRLVATGHLDDQHARGRLERAASAWRQRHPDLEIDCAVLSEPTPDRLTHNVKHTQLLVTDAHHAAALHELFSATGYAALQDARCALLIVNTPHTL
jgi:nucleotide-binding universal stress UspA family protein